MKKLSAKESTSVFGRPSEYGGQRRTQGEGGRPSRARLSSVLSDAVTDADSGIDGARNDAKGTDIRRQAGTASQTKIPGSMMLAGRCGTAVLP
ncbi:hypothetical protein CFRS1_v015832 [Colletotrichum fructicola]|nr:hypothetical protein CFRS1_v015832 [Colletotrichum fructicola]